MSSHSTDVVDLRVRNSSQTLEVELVGDALKVLDVGCATGYLGEALRRDGRTVFGVDVDGEAAEVARPRLDRVEVADVVTTPLDVLFAGHAFDAIVFGDVLEHLVDPLPVLQAATRLLAPGGALVLSIPNVTHGAVRLALLQGKWRYTEAGLLEGAHLRFFDRDSVVRLVHDAGMQITHFYATVLDPLATEVDIDQVALPDGVVEWVRRQPDAASYQFVLRAVLAEQGDGLVPEPLEPSPAVELPAPDDVHARRARRDQQESAELLEWQLDRLRHRDAVMGLEAAAARADAERGRVEAERDAIAIDITNLRASMTWRVGRVLMLPARALRALVRALR